MKCRYSSVNYGIQFFEMLILEPKTEGKKSTQNKTSCMVYKRSSKTDLPKKFSKNGLVFKSAYHPSKGLEPRLKPTYVSSKGPDSPLAFPGPHPSNMQPLHPHLHKNKQTKKQVYGSGEMA